LGNIKLVRIDSRLIHGQVITKWIPITGSKTVIIIDDELYKDDFMGQIYASAAPKGVKCSILSVNEAIKRLQEDRLSEGNTMILFQDIENCYQAFKKGFTFNDLQLGELPKKGERINVFKAISFDLSEALKLKEISDSGVDVVLQPVPELSKTKLEKVLKQFKL